MNRRITDIVIFWIILQRIWVVYGQEGVAGGNVLKQFSCDFEENYCGWKNDSKAEFTWLRNKGKTPSDETGPPWDHTTEDANSGYYLYIETSLPRKNGDKARIISPTLNSPGTHCLRFWHHMHGNDVEDLNVYMKETRTGKTISLTHLSGPWSNEGILHLRAFGSSGAWWNILEVELSPTNPVQIVIEGVRGKNYRGDIAIDDISLRSGRCETKSPDCDFENNACGWSQMSRDEFNWFPNKGETHTLHTGPSIDHTLGTSDGRYLYIESSWPRNEGDRALLLSPPISCVPNSRPVFRFWFYMSGNTLGPLRVYVVANGTQKLGDPIWKINGEQGEMWQKAEVVIPMASFQNLDRFHIIIEGERKEFRGDAAIDDFSLIGCDSAMDFTTPFYETSTENFTTAVPEMSTAPLTTFIPTIMPDQLICDFDSDSFCAWNNDVLGEFEWSLHQGPTESLGTGPSFDHTTGYGWYAYIESSSPRESGDRALLRSPTVSSSHHVCISFYYHMFGQTMGKLEVLTAESGTRISHSKWSISGEQSTNDTDWRSVAIDISEPFNYDIIIQGIRGDNFYSDIAIDDIMVAPNPCPTEVTVIPNTDSSSVTTSTPNQESASSNPHINCDFDEHGFCNWHQLSRDDFDFTLSTGGTTPSRETGPIGDNTGGGQFAYIESSRPQQSGHVSSIESSFLNASSFISCFTIWYHMHGSQTGSLSVYQVYYQNISGTLVATNKKRLWIAVGDMGQDWKQLLVNLEEYELSTVVVEASVGAGWRGDIAIDDIVLLNEECPIINCTFQYGTCAWEQETKEDDFDWTRNRKKTPTANTGPESDHTYGDGTGYYLFIETSPPRVPGDRARLISPIITPAVNSSSKCLRFWYHTFGENIGSLNVFKRSPDDVDSFMGSPLWSQAEDEGNQWLHARITIDDSFPYKIVIEGKRGTRYRGDIAIDDVSLSDGACPSCCSNDVFKCGNNLCIPVSKRCDGIDDCEDGSDESFCDACGQTFRSPVTSSNYGNIVDNIQIASETVSSPGIRNGKFRAILINNEQLSLIRHRGNPSAPSDLEPTIDEELEFEQIALQRAPEIIRLRKKRSSHVSSGANPKFTTAQEVFTTHSSQTSNTTEKRSFSTATESEETTQASKTSRFLKATFSPKSKVTEEEEISEKEALKKKQPNGYKTKPLNLRPSSVYRPRFPVTSVQRGPARITSLQWARIRRVLNRDREDNEEEEEREEEEEEQMLDEEESSDPAKRGKRSATLRIIGGDTAVAHSWPWHGVYYIINSYSRDSNYLCGATLIDPYWAVTAAHCSQLGDQHILVFGEHDLFAYDGTEQEMKIEALYLNKHFKVPDNLAGDIALIKMKYPAQTNFAVQPACLPSPDEPEFSPGLVCGITGLGRAHVNVEASLESVLRQGEVPIVTQQVCDSSYITSISDSMLCAGGLSSNTCKGDSGGPLICLRNNTSYLAGITSWGDEKCRPDIPGIYTKVKSFLKWMSRIRKQVDSCSN